MNGLKTSGKAANRGITSGFRFYRFMRYRIVYKIDVENTHVIIWAIGHRSDIYENLGDNLLKFER